MALTDENGGGIPATMLVSPSNFGGGIPYPVYQQGGQSGNSGFGGDNGWWIVLLIILLAAGGWNNNNQGGGFGGGQPIIVNDGAGGGAIQRGFDQAAVMGGINGIQSGVQALSTQLCNCCCDMQNTVNQGFFGTQNALNAGFNNAETAANARQMANMQTAFAGQTAMAQGFNNLSSQFADCCCENRLATERLNYTIATENCADRYEAAQNTRDIIENANRNNQSILDKLCQLELDSVKQNYENRIAGLQNALDQSRSDNQGLRFIASQTAQTAEIQRGQVGEVDALYQRLRDCPVPTQPVYGSQPIFTCPQNQYNNCGCGCGCGGNGNF